MGEVSRRRPTWFESDEYETCRRNGGASTLYGISAEDMTRDELLAMIGWIFKYRDTFSICFGGNSATLFERKR